MLGTLRNLVMKYYHNLNSNLIKSHQASTYHHQKIDLVGGELLIHFNLSENYSRAY